MTKLILLDLLLQEVTMKGNPYSNLSNTTKPIFLDSLLQEVIAELCINVFMLMNTKD